MAISKYALKTIPLIDRPALMTSIPTIKDSTYFLDLGANSSCTPEQLYQFASMGNVIAREIRGIDQPRIGLLNMGVEASKGNQVIKAAGKLMNSSSMNFVGYVEGNNLVEDIADVVVCDGFTGNIALKTIPSIDRPALMTSIPTIKDSTYFLDLGANSSCTPEQLYQFALMGNVIAREIRGIDQPRIGLLNMGVEASKGNQVIKEAAKLMNSSSMNFIGYVEGNNLVEDIADVVVCDGFTGNIALKTMEGSVRLVFRFLEDAFNSSAFNKFSSIVSKSAVNQMKDKIDPRRYNGALLLGLNGVVVKSHGDSDSFGIHHALITAIEEVQKGIIAKLIGAF